MRRLLKFGVWAFLFVCVWVAGYKITPIIKARIVESESERYARMCENLADSAVKDVVKPSWLTDTPMLWAHAGAGGEILYANAVEAFDASISNGFKILEVDVSITSDGVPVMSHCFRPNGSIEFDEVPTVDEFLAKKICGRFTPLTLEMFLKRYRDFDGYICVDQTENSRASGFDLIGFLERHSTAEQLARMIFQAYTLDDLQRLKGHNPFGFIHYCLGREAWDPKAEANWAILIPALKACGVTSISFGDMPIDTRLCRLVKTFSGAGFVVSVANVNDFSRAEKWMSIGVECFDTDYMVPSNRHIRQ